MAVLLTASGHLVPSSSGSGCGGAGYQHVAGDSAALQGQVGVAAGLGRLEFAADLAADGGQVEIDANAGGYPDPDVAGYRGDLTAASADRAEPHSAGCRADHDRPVDHIDVEIAAGGARLKAAQTAGATDVRRGGHHRTGRFAGHENREFEGGTAAQPGAFGRDHEQPAVAEVDPGPIGGLLIALAARALGEQGDRGGRGWLGDDGDVSRREPDLQVDRPVGGEFPGSHGLVPFLSRRPARTGTSAAGEAGDPLAGPPPGRRRGGTGGTIDGPADRADKPRTPDI